MQYVILIYQDERSPCRADPGLDTAAALERAAGVLADHRLCGTYAATSIRNAPGGLIVADGPFADSAESLSDVFVIDVAHLDDALQCARLVAESAAGVEIRPVRTPA